MAQAMVNQSPTTVALLGFDGSQQASMELFLSRHMDGFELVPEKHASAIIFNADQSSNIQQLQDDYRQQYNKPGVVVSIQALQWPGMVSLQKPFGTKELTSSLQQLQSQLSTDQTSPANQPEPSESELREVLESFRASVHKGEDLNAANDAKLNQKKAFQHGLMERKRRAEQLAQQAVQDSVRDSGNDSKGSLPTVSTQQSNEQQEQTEKPLVHLSDLLAQQTTSPGPTYDFEHDLAVMAEEVMASNANSTDGVFNATGYHGVPLLLDPSVQDVQDSCGNQPDYNLNEPSLRRHAFFNPEGQLMAMAFDARRRGQNTEQMQSVVGLPNQRLHYDPRTDEFLCTLEYDVLLQMAQARFGFGELQLQPFVNDEDEPLSALNRFSAVALLWRLSCYSAKGRLMEGLSYERRYQLDAQLPSNVIIDLPRTTALIKLWQSENLSALEVMEKLHVEQRFVFPFMTAAINLGWLK